MEPVKKSDQSLGSKTLITFLVVPSLFTDRELFFLILHIKSYTQNHLILSRSEVTYRVLIFTCRTLSRSRHDSSWNLNHDIEDRTLKFWTWDFLWTTLKYETIKKIISREKRKMDPPNLDFLHLELLDFVFLGLFYKIGLIGRFKGNMKSKAEKYCR